MNIVELKPDAELRCDDVREVLTKAVDEGFCDITLIGIRRDKSFKVICSASPDLLRKIGALQFAIKDLMASVDSKL